jgi:hypothetical protein
MLFRDAGHVTTKRFEQPKCTFWSAVTCHRFGRMRPVAAMVGSTLRTDCGVKPPKTKAVTGGVPSAAAALGCSRHRTPKAGLPRPSPRLFCETFKE